MLQACLQSTAWWLRVEHQAERLHAAHTEGGMGAIVAEGALVLASCAHQTM